MDPKDSMDEFNELMESQVDGIEDQLDAVDYEDDEEEGD